jgi:hypothetical protein
MVPVRPTMIPCNRASWSEDPVDFPAAPEEPNSQTKDRVSLSVRHDAAIEETRNPKSFHTNPLIKPFSTGNTLPSALRT